MKFTFLVTIAWIVTFSTVGNGQQRPLQIEDPRPISQGHVLVEVGFDFFKNAKFPLSGLNGDLSRIGDLSIHFGISPRVEISFEVSSQNFLDIKSQSSSFIPLELTRGGASTNDFGDLSVATKIVLFHESITRPTISLLWRVELPTSNERKGIGTNTTNFFAGFLLGKEFGIFRAFGKLGLGILESPAELFDQNDVLIAGGAVIYPINKKINLVAEINGRKSTRGISSLSTESLSHGRYGLQISWGGVRWDVGAMVGINKNSPANGILFGATIDRRIFF